MHLFELCFSHQYNSHKSTLKNNKYFPFRNNGERPFFSNVT